MHYFIRKIASLQQALHCQLGFAEYVLSQIRVDREHSDYQGCVLACYLKIDQFQTLSSSHQLGVYLILFLQHRLHGRLCQLLLAVS